ncbi:hypothetical protein [Roseateles noduli]|uniref:hypothetical protein n=1 Tax=Roseateles noduli TaxID=2052484 RepID=UPI003D662087
MFGMGFDPSSQMFSNQLTQDQSEDIGQAGQQLARDKQLAVFSQRITDTKIEMTNGQLGSVDKVSFR